MSGRDDIFRLLIMCTANRCRSPMAEAIAAESLRSRRAVAEVVSCGAMIGGSPPSGGAIRAMSRRGLDISSHLSNQVDADTANAADVIITMERQHITTIADLSLPAVERTFTLIEMADLAVTVGPRREGTSISSWVESLNAMRTPSAVMTMSTEDDIEDPMGGPARAYRHTADIITELLETVISRLYPEPVER